MKRYILILLSLKKYVSQIFENYPGDIIHFILMNIKNIHPENRLLEIEISSVKQFKEVIELCSYGCHLVTVDPSYGMKISDGYIIKFEFYIKLLNFDNFYCSLPLLGFFLDMKTLYEYLQLMNDDDPLIMFINKESRPRNENPGESCIYIKCCSNITMSIKIYYAKLKDILPITEKKISNTTIQLNRQHFNSFCKNLNKLLPGKCFNININEKNINIYDALDLGKGYDLNKLIMYTKNDFCKFLHMHVDDHKSIILYMDIDLLGPLHISYTANK